MNSIELLIELEDNNDLIFNNEFLSEIPNSCLIKFLENLGWERTESNLEINARFYGIGGEYKKIIIPEDDKDWIDNAVRWTHNIRVLSSYYDSSPVDVVFKILEA